MSFLNKIKDKLVPEPSGVPLSTSASGGIGNRRGTLGFEDDVSSVSHNALQYRVASALPYLFSTTLNPLYVTMFILLYLYPRP